MEGSEQIRLEALKVLTDLAVNDDRFRSGLRHDLDDTLTSYGFDLNEKEVAQIRKLVRAFDESIRDEVFGAVMTEQHR